MGIIENKISKVLLEKYRMVPPQGGWVFLKGNPRAPRGYRMPNFCKDLDIRHMDVYWAYNEEIEKALMSRIAHSLKRFGNITDEDILDKANFFINDGGAFCIDTGGLQITKVQISHPHQDRVCFWNGEISPIKDINEYLAENVLMPFRFGEEEEFNPIADEAIRDVIGSLQLDGMTKSQAYNEAISMGLLTEKDKIVPKMFYRFTEAYTEMFVEEFAY